MTQNDLGNVYKLIDRYVKINFLLRLLASHSSKTAEEFNSKVFDIDFNELALSEEAVKDLSESPNIMNLKKYRDEIIQSSSDASLQIFGYIRHLSIDEKISIKEYVDNMIAVYLTKIGNCQDEYLALVFEIDKSTKEDNSTKTRELGKKAKISFNKLYEFNTICQNYSNIGGYLNGLIKNSKLK